MGLPRAPTAVADLFERPHVLDGYPRIYGPQYFLNADDDGSRVSGRAYDQTLKRSGNVPIRKIEFRFRFHCERRVARIGDEANDLDISKLAHSLK